MKLRNYEERNDYQAYETVATVKPVEKTRKGKDGKVVKAQVHKNGNPVYRLDNALLEVTDPKDPKKVLFTVEPGHKEFIVKARKPATQKVDITTKQRKLIKKLSKLSKQSKTVIRIDKGLGKSSKAGSITGRFSAKKSNMIEIDKPKRNIVKRKSTQATKA